MPANERLYRGHCSIFRFKAPEDYFHTEGQETRPRECCRLPLCGRKAKIFCCLEDRLKEWKRDLCRARPAGPCHARLPFLQLTPYEQDKERGHRYQSGSQHKGSQERHGSLRNQSARISARWYRISHEQAFLC